VFISLVKDPNVQFVSARKDFFALAMICPFSPPSKSHFVQPNVVCPAPVVPAVPTFWTPASNPAKLSKKKNQNTELYKE
jgi:hypothetical protein